jgi:hypothetical protein
VCGKKLGQNFVENCGVSSSTFWLRRVVQRFAAILIWSRIVSIYLFDELIDSCFIFRLIFEHFGLLFLDSILGPYVGVAWVMSHAPTGFSLYVVLTLLLCLC